MAKYNGIANTKDKQGLRSSKRNFYWNKTHSQNRKISPNQLTCYLAMINEIYLMCTLLFLFKKTNIYYLKGMHRKKYTLNSIMSLKVEDF